MRGAFHLLKRTFEEWKQDRCSSMAAALSYYTVFSLPPLLLLLLTLLGLVLDPSDVQGRVSEQISSLIGLEGAEQVRAMIRNVERPEVDVTFLSVAGIAGLLIGATGALAQLQEALNRAWEVAPDPEKGGLIHKLGKRVLSLGMILTLGFLLLVSLALSAVLSAFGDQLSTWLPGALSSWALRLMSFGLSFAVIAFLFGLIFKFMPDARVGWRDVAVGAVGTAGLFIAGKLLLSEYLARSDPGQAFGAAGSLALILVWVYYSSMIVLFGAEFTQVWAAEHGGGVLPDEHAVRVIETRRHVRAEGPAPDSR